MGYKIMGYTKYAVKFPCGYEFIVKVFSLFSVFSFDDEDLPLCPIHRNKCRKIKK